MTTEPLNGGPPGYTNAARISPRAARERAGEVSGRE